MAAPHARHNPVEVWPRSRLTICLEIGWPPVLTGSNLRPEHLRGLAP